MERSLQKPLRGTFRAAHDRCDKITGESSWRGDGDRMPSSNHLQKENSMHDRVNQGVNPPPANLREMKRFLSNVKHDTELTQEQIDAFAKEAEAFFEGGYNHRDEANALVCMAVRNGPIENLHAGKSSPLLTDDTLSRMTDDEIKAVMIYASQMVAFLLWLRDEAPEVYKRYVQAYGMMYCRKWERA